MNPLIGLSSSLNKLGTLPGPVKAIVSLLGGGSLIGVAYLLFGGNKTAVFILTIGLVVVFGLLVLYKLLLKLLNKRKSNPLSMGIAGNAAAAPQGISEPARRARLDDLRRNFEQGVEKFRAAGKNLYSVPWYVVVGEPGSGKTEAIRHCNVGFPPGLQDQLQGAGGTLNMNWWFTNQAIILDTAGRLMFEEVAPGSTNEWQEFLKLLKISRPNCPINGMLLVIPVDTLIKDTADSIEKKSSKIAQQFDQIQRSLGVRFPVFIIITKCDLLNGFREFFDGLSDPQLQHQIMGWSNPASLDDKFDPKAVDTHLETVKTRLAERRQHLILDPVNTEDPQGRRIDQVDALYALPDSITKIAPRLRRYLETIFVSGEWSPKPLFLRGIYFTSSMTEGSALDAELADVLGVPVDSLPEGRVWRRDRAYFLRDLFIEKVFRERGLVTRADNADKQQRTRRAIVLTCGFLAVVVLFALTWFGSRQLETSIGKHRDFWLSAAGQNAAYNTIIKKDRSYSTDTFKVLNKDTTIAGFFGDNLKLVQDEIRVPLIFKPMTLLGGNVNAQRHTAYRSYFEATVLYPVYDAARKKLPTLTKETWSDDATGALAQLMKLEYANVTKKTPEGDPHPQVDLAPLFAAVLQPADLPKFKADEAGLQRTADWIYSPEADGTSAWPAAALQPGAPASLAAINQGVTTTIAYWQNQATENGPRLSSIFAVRKALADFRTAEDELLRLKARPIDTLVTYNAFLTTWQAAFTRLTDARNRAMTAWTNATKGAGENATLTSLYTDEVSRIATDAQHAYESLLKLTPEAPADAKSADTATGLLPARQQLTAAISALASWKNDPNTQATLADISALDAAYLVTVKGADDAQHHRFDAEAGLYAMADKFLVKPDGANAPTSAGSMADTLNKLNTNIANASNTVDVITQPATTGDRLEQAGKLTNFVVDVGARRQRYGLVKDALAGMPTDPQKWLDFVAARATPLPRPQIPLVAFVDKTFPAKFSPDAVGSINESLTAINTMATDPSGAKVLDAPTVTRDVATVRSNFNEYLKAYMAYWKEEVFTELHFGAKNWSEFSGQIASLRERTVRSALEDYGNAVQAALTKVNDTADASSIASAVIIGQKKAFQDACHDLIGHWSDLGDNYRQARPTLLKQQPRDFLDYYTVGEAKGDDGFVAHYWQNFTLEGIRLLANDSQADILGGLKELGKYERFPLAPAGDPKLDLTAEELVSARAALDKVVGSAATNAPGGNAKSIGMGATTRDKDLDEWLDRLRGTNILRDQQDYLNRLTRFIAALPADTKPMTVTVSVLKEKLKDDNSVSQKWAYMNMAQTDVPSAIAAAAADPAKKEATTKEAPKAGANAHILREAFLGGMVADKADIAYAGGDFLLQFKDIPQGEILKTETFNGPWSPFRLLASPNVKSVTHDATKWNVEYNVVDSNNKVWVLWLQLEFKAEVPDLKEWPVPPAGK